MKENKNTSGYKTPENYFESFEERLFDKISEEGLPKSSGFKSPDNYFENMEERVLKTITNLEKPKKVIQLFPKKYFVYAAAIAACLVIGFSLFNNKTDSSNLDSLQLAAIDAYIEEGNLNLDFYDLTTYINDDNITNLDIDELQFSDGVLEDYILENMDADILINEQ